MNELTLERRVKLTGVGGWLAFYIWIPSILSGLTGMIGIDPLSQIVGTLSVIAGLYALFGHGPAVRTFQIIWGWSISAFMWTAVLQMWGAGMMDVDSAPELVGGAIGSIIWPWYWMVSKRVKLTYCRGDL